MTRQTMNDQNENPMPFDPLMPPPPLEDEENEPEGHDTLHGDSAEGTIIPNEGNTVDSSPETPVMSDSETIPGNVKQSMAALGRQGMPSIEGYVVESKLGQGGMGAVYKARDQKLNRHVAIKLISSQSDAKAIGRFEREIATVAALQHPNIAQLFDAETNSERPYYVMELVEGQTLEDKIGAEPQSANESARMIMTLGKALAFCHERDTIHRDLKPSNVLLDLDSVPKLTDFGLAKTLCDADGATRTGEIMGTPGYMSPEQASGVVKQLGPACDVYGLGAILYRMLTGRAPFASSDPMQTVMKVLSDDPVPPRKLQPEIPRDIETICLKCLEKKADKRYASAADLVDDLQRFLNGEPIVARPTSVVERTAKWCRRRPAFATLVVVSSVLVPLIIGGQWFYSGRLNDSLTQSKQLTGQLNTSLQEKTELANDLDKSLTKSTKLATEGSDLSVWLLRDHIYQLQSVPGTTKVQHGVIQRIQEYLDAATPEVPANALFTRRHASAYEMIANIQGNPTQQNLGMKKEALANYQRAIKIYDKALTYEPNDRKTKMLKAQCMMSMSDVEFELFGDQRTNETLKTAYGIVEQLGEVDDSTESIAIRISAGSYKMDMYKRQGKFEESLEVSYEVEKLIRKIVDREDVADASRYKLVANTIERNRILGTLGRYEDALEEAKQARKDCRVFIDAHPDDSSWKELEGTVLVNVADNLTKLEEFEDASEFYEEALTARRELARLDPANNNAKVKLALSLSRMADITLLLSAPDANNAEVVSDARLIKKAFGYLEEISDIRRELVKSNSENRQYRRELWMHMRSMGEAYGRNGQYDRAIKAYQEQEQTARSLLDIEQPDIVDIQGIAESEHGQGLVQFQIFGEIIFDEQDVFKGDPEGVPAYKKALEHNAKSLKVFDRMEKIQPLSDSQKSYRETVKTTGDLFRETVRKYKTLMNGDG